MQHSLDVALDEPEVKRAAEYCMCGAKCATKAFCSCKNQGRSCELQCHPKNKKCENK